MITDEELRISSMSYTEKDFIRIYPELLDIIKKISPKWDPSTSNESDPGNVLLKAMAFMADKINYNTDKATLDVHLPSVTQENAARNIFEERGYYPKYYQSAITSVKFRYVGKNLAAGDSFTFPAMSTVISDVDDTISYSLMQPLTITGSKITSEAVQAIQGTFASLEVGTGDTIQLSDLDDNNRIYFPETLVAQNGVFVYNKNSFVEGVSSADNSDSEGWRLVDNLNLEAPSSTNRVFKFGFDSKKSLPYIEFPDNISDLIEEGLIIKYVKTSGANGNITAGFLTKLISPLQIETNLNGDTINFELPDENSTDETYDANNLTIYNTGSTISGRNPETIDEAYNGFKKTVGTFDTLVTCRDYANAIYNLIDNTTGLPYVSNVQVADRRSDVNYGNSIVTYTSLGKTLKLDTSNEDITPFDLCLYPLQPITQVYDYYSYINSFTPLINTKYLEDEVETLKTLSHTYKELDDSDIYVVKAYYKLNARITTTYKVNAFEQESLTDLIKTALYKKFNAREVDYGYEIPFDEILETIQNADPIIKNVSLDEPEIDIRVRFGGTNEEEISLFQLINTSSGNVRKLYIDVLAKNILAGRLSMFDYDTSFVYEFGQSKAKQADDNDITVVNNLCKIATELKITPGGSGLDYTLRENEIIQCIAPNLETTMTYPAYVYFRYEATDTTKTIRANEEHKITGDESLKLTYTDSNKNIINVEYVYNGIITNGVLRQMDEVFIKPNFVLSQVKPRPESGRTSIEKDFNGTTYAFYTLAASEQIEERQPVIRVLSDTQVYCYWSTTRSNNILFTDDDAVMDGSDILYYETLLGENEYFAYCDSAKTEVVIRGSGTKLRYYKTTDLTPGEWECKKGAIETLAEGGISVFDNFNWKVKNFSNTYIEIQDMQILTLAEGDKIKIDLVSGATLPEYITNDFQQVNPLLKIEYKFKGEPSFEDPLPQFSDASMSWQIRSRLDINCGPNLPQEIKGADTSATGDSSFHKIRFTEVTSTSPFTTVDHDVIQNYGKNTYFTLNKLVQVAGGSNVDVTVTQISSAGFTVSYDISTFVYNYTPVQYTVIEDGLEVDKDLEAVGNYYSIPLSSLKNVTTSGYSLELPILNFNDTETMLMFFVMSDEGSTFDVELSSGNSSSDKLLRLYQDSSFVHSIPLNHYYREETDDDVYVSGTTYYKISGDAYVVDTDVTDAASYATEKADHDLYTKVLSAETISNVVVKQNAVDLVIAVSADAADESNCYLIISKISKIKTSNSGTQDTSSLFGLNLIEENYLRSRIKELDTKSIFYYNNPVDKGSVVDVTATATPQFFWDKNNLFNKMTIGEIDFDKSSFSIVKSSQV